MSTIDIFWINFSLTAIIVIQIKNGFGFNIEISIFAKNNLWKSEQLW